jgi:hypothetical protein
VAGAAPDGKFCSESINGWPLLSLMKQGVNDRYGRFRAGAGPRGMSASGTSQPAEQRPPWVESGSSKAPRASGDLFVASGDRVPRQGNREGSERIAEALHAIATAISLQ